METTIGLAISAIEGLLPLLSGAVPTQLQGVIDFLEKIIPTVVQEAEDVLPSIQNIIAALQGNGAVTADQITQLQAQSATVDAALDAAAKDDNLSG
jgi:hypothetical protein